MGRIYGRGLMQPLLWTRWRIYHGMWGCAPFQSLYQREPGQWRSLPLMPEWYLLIAALTVLSVLGALWSPLLVTLPLLLLAMAATVTQAVLGGRRAVFVTPPRSRADRIRLKAMTAGLHLMQPLARLCGRLSHGLTPWRRRKLVGLLAPYPRVLVMWSERWRSPVERLARFEQALSSCGASVMRGGDYDSWDLEVRGGLLGAMRVRTAVEEHGSGRQLFRIRMWPHCASLGLAFISLFAVAAVAAFDRAWLVFLVLGTMTACVASRMALECADVAAAIVHAHTVLVRNESWPRP
jgi:hypothetical protein